MFDRIGNIVNYILGRDTKEVIEVNVESEDVHIPHLKDFSSSLDEIDLNKYNLPNKLGNTQDKGLLLMDDVKHTSSLYSIDFKRIQRRHNKNILSDFTVITAYGRECGFQVAKYIKEEENPPITHALLDITLGYSERLPSGDLLEIDGIDIAMELIKSNPDIKFLFCTSHSNCSDVSTMKYYFDKFEKEGYDISKYIIDKNSSERYEDIYKFLYADGV